jgi:hypothetical protein
LERLGGKKRPINKIFAIFDEPEVLNSDFMEMLANPAFFGLTL